MNVEIIPARPDQRPLIEGLFQFYADDFSTFEAMDSVEFELDSNGQFAAYAPMGAYWREPSRIPLLITAGGRAAGFALINAISHSGAEVDRNMAEFFVRRKYRRGGVGREAVRQILTLYPGRWEIAIAARNAPALAFWPSAVAAVSAVADLTEVAGDGEHWRGPILRFVMPPTG